MAGAASAPGLVPWSGLPWKTDSSLIDTLDLSVLAPDTPVSRVRAQAPMDTMPHVHMSDGRCLSLLQTPKNF